MKGLSDYFPNGCSQDQRNEFVRKLMNSDDRCTAFHRWSTEEKCLDRQISALDMLDSCFAYHGFSRFYKKSSWQYKSYYDEYLNDYIECGGNKEEFDKMLDIQKKHLEKCMVLRNVHTDFEGCSYNSIQDFDEVTA